MKDMIIGVLMRISFGAAIGACVIGIDLYQHRCMSNCGPARPIMREDVECDADTHTITLKIGNYIGGLWQVIELCGWETTRERVNNE